MSPSLVFAALVTSLLGCAGASGDEQHGGESEQHGNEPAKQRSAAARSSACSNTPDGRAPADTTALADDQLESLNGFDIADPEQALEAFNHLRTASCVQVELNRRGESTNLQIHIE